MSNQKTEAELNIKSAVYDAGCWYLHSDTQATEESLIQEWPESWPNEVNKQFLEGRGIAVYDA